MWKNFLGLSGSAALALERAFLLQTGVLESLVLSPAPGDFEHDGSCSCGGSSAEQDKGTFEEVDFAFSLEPLAASFLR